jgi:hypothetical protein
MNKWPLKVGAVLAGTLLVCAFATAQSHAGQNIEADYSAPALYDLGNQAARAGKPALAVLNYERALLLAPNDEDARANLNAVRKSAGIMTPPANWLARHARLGAPNLMYWLGLLGLVLGGGGMLAYRLRVPKSKPMAVAALMGAAIVVASIGDAVATMPVLDEAVVMQASPASASPVVGAEPQFTLPVAEVVRIRDRHQRFVLVEDSLNRQGWIPESNVASVIPAQERDDAI